MALEPVIRLGDPSSHGGAMVTASTTVFANGIGTCRDGDILACPIHGDNPVTGTGVTIVEGRRRIVVGDQAACGAVMIQGSPDVLCDG